MGLFDYAVNQFNPYQDGLLGALGINPGARQPESAPPDDIMNPINSWGAITQGHAPLSALLGRAAELTFPPLNGGPQSTIWMPAQQPPAAGGGSAPQLPPPINVQSAPQFGQAWSPDMAPVGGAPQMPMNISPQAVNGMPSNMAPPNPPQMPQQAAPQKSVPFNPLNSFGDAMQNIAAGFSPGLRPTWGEIGTDITGNKQFGWIDSNKGTINGQPVGSSGGQIGYPRGADGQPLQGAELLSHLKNTDPAAASMVTAIIRGDASVTGRNLQKYLPIATLVDPGLQQFNYDTRKKTAIDFTAGGKSANNVKSLETIGGHLDKMSDAFDKMGNGQIPAWNTFKNGVSSAFGGAAQGGFETFANGVSNELGTVFRSAGMSDAEVKSWRDRITSSSSPDQFNENMRNLLDMLHTRKEALAEQYKNGMGRDLSPETFQKLDGAIAKIEKRFQLPTGTNEARPGGLKAGTYQWTPQGIAK